MNNAFTTFWSSSKTSSRSGSSGAVVITVSATHPSSTWERERERVCASSPLLNCLLLGTHLVAGLPPPSFLADRWLKYRYVPKPTPSPHYLTCEYTHTPSPSTHVQPILVTKECVKERDNRPRTLTHLTHLLHPLNRHPPTHAHPRGQFHQNFTSSFCGGVWCFDIEHKSWDIDHGRSDKPGCGANWKKIARFEKLENLSSVFQNSLAFLGANWKCKFIRVSRDLWLGITSSSVELSTVILVKLNVNLNSKLWVRAHLCFASKSWWNWPQEEKKKKKGLSEILYIAL